MAPGALGRNRNKYARYHCHFFVFYSEETGIMLISTFFLSFFPSVKFVSKLNRIFATRLCFVTETRHE